MEAIAAPIRAAIELFETTLSEVRFPDVDARTLASAAAEVDAAGRAVSSAQAALDSARSALQERQDALLGQVYKAIAYARVYAENDEALIQRLNEIALPRGGRVPRKDDALVLSAVPDVEANPRRRKRRSPMDESEPMLARAMSGSQDGQTGVAQIGVEVGAGNLVANHAD
jgi:hypothetical protein